MFRKMTKMEKLLLDQLTTMKAVKSIIQILMELK